MKKSPTNRTFRLTAFSLAAVLLGGGAVACNEDDVSSDSDGSAAPTAEEAAAENGALTEEQLRQRVEETLEEGGYIGLAVQVRNGEDVITAEAGEAELGTGEPVPEGGSFRAASTTKPVVAAAVLDLVAEGQLSLDDTVEDLLPGMVQGNGNDGSVITVRHLLLQTSGLFDYIYGMQNDAESFEELRYHDWDPEELVAMAMEHEPVFPTADPEDPEPQWGYSNTNYVLAGLVIEAVTGNHWAEEVNDRILEPLGMTDTYEPGNDPDLPEPFMRTYQQWPGSEQWVDTTNRDLSTGDAAGSLVTTARDLDRFFTGLLDGSLLPPEIVEELTTTVPTDENFQMGFPGAEYGLGVMSQPTDCGGLTWGHGGDLEGSSVRNATTEDTQRSIIIATSGKSSDEEQALAAEQAIQQLIGDAVCGAGE